MLGKLRDPRQNTVLKYLIYTALGVIIVVFAISFGPGSFGRRNPRAATQAASVDGQIITAAALNRAYGQALERYRSIAGRPLKPEEAEAMGLRKQVLDSLIERELVARAAVAHGIRVSDDELKKTIMETEFFQVDGKFDPKRYQQIVNNYFGLPRAKYEAELRKDLLAQKMRLALKETVKVSPEEVKAAYIRENDKIDLEYVRFSPYQFKDTVQVDDAKIDEVLEKRHDEVEAFYDRNKFRYNRPKRVHAHHILIKPASDSAEDKAAAKKKAEEVLAKIRAGEDFETLAKSVSDDQGNKDKGGDLGWFGPGAMARPFEEAAFALGAGEVSDVVETKFGYHIIRVDEVREAEQKTLDQVEREVARLILADDLAKERAKAEAEALLEQAKASNETLMELAPPPAPPKPGEAPAARPKFSATSTGLVAIQGDYVSGIGKDADLAAAVRALTPDHPLLDRVFEVGGAFYVIRLKERRVPDMKAFEAQKKDVEKRLLAAKQRQIEKAWIAALRDSADVRTNQAVLLGGGKPS